MSLGFACELTPRCNLECRFCYNVWRAEGQHTPQELKIADWARIVDRAVARQDVHWITLTGGEPLLSEALEPLVAHLRRHHSQVRVGVCTNGTLLDSQRLHTLIALGVSHFELSLFTLDSGRYRALTGHDCVEQAKLAIALVAAAPVSLTVAITLLPTTAGDLASVIEYAWAVGADCICLNRFAPTGMGARNRNEFTLGPNVLDESLGAANARAAHQRMPIDVTIPVEDCLVPNAGFPALRFHGCACGRAKWAIGPDGGLRSCEQSSTVIGNLLTDDFASLRDGPAASAFRSDTRIPDCATCVAWQTCGGGCRFVRSGGPEAPEFHPRRLTVVAVGTSGGGVGGRREVSTRPG